MSDDLRERVEAFIMAQVVLGEDAMIPVDARVALIPAERAAVWEEAAEYLPMDKAAQQIFRARAEEERSG